MSMQEPDEITPQSLVNIRPIVAAIKADATPVSTKEQIANVGTISAGDAEIGEKIAEARLVLPRLDETIDKLVEEGLAAWSEDRLRPTERGWLLGNELYGALFDLA